MGGGDRCLACPLAFTGAHGEPIQIFMQNVNNFKLQIGQLQDLLHQRGLTNEYSFTEVQLHTIW